VMFRLAFLVVLVAVVLLAFRVAFDAGRAMTGSLRARRRAARPQGTREWDRRTDQVKRQLKGVATRDEPREEMIAWVEAHAGVEAYVEPKTMMSPLSVVFVDGDGAWKRFPLAEDRFLRALAKDRGIPVFDASRVGYPPRMRRERSDDAPES
jgi:hypothetical protein